MAVNLRYERLETDFVPCILSIPYISSLSRGKLEKNKKIFFNIGLLVIFVWLLITSYSQSKRKPDNIGELLNDFSWLGGKWPKWLDLPLMNWINVGFKTLNEKYGYIFEAINNVLLYMLMLVKNFLIQAPWPLVILGVVVLTYFASGRKVGTTVFVGFCTFFIGFLHPIFWQKAIETTAIMLIGIFLCVVAGIPLGIAMARSVRTRNVILPVLDLMQTIPSFVYLMPIIMLLGIGKVPGLLAVCIYALPPVVRLTNLGIREVDKETLEASEAFGATPMQKLKSVQIPLALPTVFAGVNQTIMMALAMVVIASMIGVKGLGVPILRAVSNQYLALGMMNGLAIVALAIVFDRVTQEYGRRIQKHRGQIK